MAISLYVDLHLDFEPLLKKKILHFCVLNQAKSLRKLTQKQNENYEILHCVMLLLEVNRCIGKLLAFSSFLWKFSFKVTQPLTNN